MLHMFHTYVATVCSKMFQLFQSYVTISDFMLQVASVIFWMFHVFDTHVASAYSKCFIYIPTCFFFMLQVFYVVWPRAEGRGAPGEGLQKGALGQLTVAPVGGTPGQSIAKSYLHVTRLLQLAPSGLVLYFLP